MYGAVSRSGVSEQIVIAAFVVHHLTVLDIIMCPLTDAFFQRQFHADVVIGHLDEFVF